MFINIKTPLHQDAPDSCTPTCIKVILKNQFNVDRKISAVKKWLNYTLGCGSCSPYNTPSRLEEPLTQFNIESLTQSNGTNKHLIELLEKGITPFVFLKLNYLNETGISNIKTYDGGEEWWHCIVICGFNEADESIFIYDPLLTYSETNLTQINCKVKMSYTLFTKYWKATNNKLFWLASTKGSSAKNKEKQLQLNFKK